jgi:antiviral helicase SKI2
MRQAIDALSAISTEWAQIGSVPEVDWSRSMRQLEFQEGLRERNASLQKISSAACTLCAEFDEHVSTKRRMSKSALLIPIKYSIIHSSKVLKAKIAELKLAISDQNLDLIPDYEQRIEVLQDLKFIDENSTVLLKGRVACEVSNVNHSLCISHRL